MEPEEYIEYFEDTILNRTPKLGQKGCCAKVSRRFWRTNSPLRPKFAAELDVSHLRNSSSTIIKDMKKKYWALLGKRKKSRHCSMREAACLF